MPSNQPAVDFDSLVAPRPAVQRWPDLEAYGIAFQVAVYQNGHEDIIATGDKSYGDKLEQLGFIKVNDEWTLPVIELNPREVLSVFPKMVMDREMLASKIFVDRTSLMPPTLEGSKTASLKTAIHERLKSRIEAAVDFASIIAPRAATQRWLNLEAYGMEAKIAVYNDGSDAAHIVGGDKYADKLQKLGFTKINDEWTIPLARLKPREVLHSFPKMTVDREMPASKVFVDRTHLAPPDLHLSEEEKRIAAHLGLKARIDNPGQEAEPAPSALRL